MRARAQKLAERDHMREATQLRQEFLQNLHKSVMRYIKQGHTADHACKLTADHTGVQLSTVKYRWKDFLDDKHQKAVKQRNALAYELHTIGYTNVIIAERLNIHPVTVSRILKAEKEKRIKLQNPNRLKLFSQHTENKDNKIVSISSHQ